MGSNTVLKPRFKNHFTLNDVVYKDWVKSVEFDPESFQALIYLPEDESEAIEQDLYEQPDINVLDTNQQQLSYQDPFVVFVVDNPSDTQAMVSESGDSAITDFENPMLLRIAHHNIPVGAILEWIEVVSKTETKRCWWYIHSSISVGTTLAGVLHNAIPCRDFEGMIQDDE